jgi:hypothetical protein
MTCQQHQKLRKDGEWALNNPDHLAFLRATARFIAPAKGDEKSIPSQAVMEAADGIAS